MRFLLRPLCVSLPPSRVERPVKRHALVREVRANHLRARRSVARGGRGKLNNDLLVPSEIETLTLSTLLPPRGDWWRQLFFSVRMEPRPALDLSQSSSCFTERRTGLMGLPVRLQAQLLRTHDTKLPSFFSAVLQQ